MTFPRSWTRIRRRTALILLLGLAAAPAAADCPDEAVWAVFPASADLGNVVPDAQARREAQTVGAERVYTLAWPPDGGRRGITLTVRICPDAADARGKVRDYLDTLDGMVPADLGDLAGIDRNPSRTNLIACLGRVIVACSSRAATGPNDAEPVSLVRDLLGRMEALPCLAAEASPPAEPVPAEPEAPAVPVPPPPSEPDPAPAAESRPAAIPPAAVPGPVSGEIPPASAPPGTGAAQAAGLVLDLVPDPAGRTAFVDAGPNGIGSELRGNPQRLDEPGGAALRFDGRGDWLLLDATPALDLRGDLTIEVLARVPPEAISGGGYHMMVWRGDEQGGKDPYGLSLTAGALVFRRDLPKTFQATWPAAELAGGRWHVFAAVHRAWEQMLELWVDGRRVAMATLKGDFKYPTAAMHTQVGAMDDGRSQFFLGDLARVRIFRRPLTPPELSADSAALLSNR